jgi:Phage Terminase
VLYDPWQMQATAQRLVKAGLPLVEFPQSSPNLTAATQNLFDLIESQSLLLYPDPAMRVAIQQAVAIEGPRGWRIGKDKSAFKIDIIVALAMAAHAAVQGAGTYFYDKSYKAFVGDTDTQPVQEQSREPVHANDQWWKSQPRSQQTSSADQRLRDVYNAYSNDDDFEIVNGRKILKDGHKFRVPARLMDSAPKPRIADGGGGTAGLNRPGYRVVSDTKQAAIAAAKRHAAYADYERALCDEYKAHASPPAGAYPYTAAAVGKSCDGSVPSDHEGNEDEAFENAQIHHEGLSARRTDSRSVKQMMRDHQNKMADIYDKLDYELSETWRRP